MVPVKTLFTLFSILGVVAGQGHGGHGGGGGGGGHVPDQGEVNTAKVNIDLHYNDRLCLELLLVDCATHVTQGDEKVCGTDGLTYDNHCKFAHAMCEYLHSAANEHTLNIANHGACMGATMAPATSAPGNTLSPATTTTVVMTTTTMPPPTTDPISSVVQNVFCQNVPSISCGSSFEIVCGSDGQLYPNQCELSKGKCKDPTLTVADKSKCPTIGFPPHCDMAIEINLQNAMAEGYKFYKSENGVILCEGNANGAIPSKYFRRAYDIRTGDEIS